MSMQNQQISWEEVESKLSNLQPVEGGFSLARRGMVTLDNNDIVFVKIGLDNNTKKWAKKEIKTYQFLEKNNYPYIPKLLSVNDDETGFAIQSLTHFDGWDWKENWTYDRLDRTLEAMDKLASIKINDEAIKLFSEKSLSTTDDGWSKLIESPNIQDRLQIRLSEMSRQDIWNMIDFQDEAKLSAGYDFKNDYLVHNDIRSDNCAWNQTLRNVKLVDWNWTQIGDRRIDLAATLTHVYQHGLELIPDYVDRLDVDALHWCAGFWLNSGATPIWEGGSDSLRILQLTSGIAALDLRQQIIDYKSGV